MGEAVERLQENVVALSGMSRIAAYARKTKSGKTVQVAAHTRSTRSMSFGELKDEQKALGANPADPKDQNRLQQIVGELRKRGWEPDEEFDPAKAQALHKKAMQDASGREEGYDFKSRGRKRGAHA